MFFRSGQWGMHGKKNLTENQRAKWHLVHDNKLLISFAFETFLWEVSWEVGEFVG